MIFRTGREDTTLIGRATGGAFFCMILCIAFPDKSLPEISLLSKGGQGVVHDDHRTEEEGGFGESNTTNYPGVSFTLSGKNVQTGDDSEVVILSDKTETVDGDENVVDAKDARNLRRIRRMALMDGENTDSNSSRRIKNKANRSSSNGSNESRSIEEQSSNTANSQDLSSLPSCDPSKIDLASYPQWADETGHWIGQYDLYQGDGTYHESNAWNYPYNNYTGFITGNAAGPNYRQRNVFVYRPQEPQKCSEGGVWGEGQCGVNGNVKLFEADQTVTSCSSNPAFGGDLTGDFGDYFFTTTELVGKQARNAVLYQVWLKAGSFGLSPDEDLLFQSQLTTITRRKKDKALTFSTRTLDLSTEGSEGDEELDDEEVFRTRSAQEFEVFDPTKRGQPIRVSFYRERKVSKAQFYKQLDETLKEHNILPSDVCTWKNGPVGNVIASGHEGGIESCRGHLEESFRLETKRQ